LAAVAGALSHTDYKLPLEAHFIFCTAPETAAELRYGIEVILSINEISTE